LKKREWSDAEFEELLKQLPKIKDTRSKTEIYQNISVKMSKRKKRLFIMPMVATAAALLLFFILTPNLLNWQVSEEKSMGDVQNRSMLTQEKESASNDEAADIVEEAKEESFGISSYEDSKQNSMKSGRVEDYSTTAFYEDEINGMEVLTYDIPDKNAQMLIPISILVMKQENKSKFDLYKEYMGSLTEDEWGLNNYYPLNASLDLDEENHVLTVDIPAAHSYSESTTTEENLNQVLSNTMMEFNIERINLFTDGVEGIDFPHLGFQKELIRDDQPGHFSYYFYYPNETNEKPYIVPFKEKMNSIDEAFSAMKNNIKEASLVASIPADFDFEVNKDQKQQLLTLTFSKDSKIINDQSTIYTIEAILLTAKEFDFQAVKLENAKIDKIGRFNLNEALRVPVAANKQILP